MKQSREQSREQSRQALNRRFRFIEAFGWKPVLLAGLLALSFGAVTAQDGAPKEPAKNEASWLEKSPAEIEQKLQQGVLGLEQKLEKKAEQALQSTLGLHDRPCLQALTVLWREETLWQKPIRQTWTDIRSACFGPAVAKGQPT